MKNDLIELYDDFLSVKSRIKSDGLEYVIKHYSDFSEIKDEEFHKLRIELINSMSNFEYYLQFKILEIENEIDNDI